MVEPPRSMSSMLRMCCTASWSEGVSQCQLWGEQFKHLEFRFVVGTRRIWFMIRYENGKITTVLQVPSAYIINMHVKG